MSRYLKQILQQTRRDTSEWATSRLRERALLALATFVGTFIGTRLLVGLGPNTLKLSIGNGLLSLAALVVFQLLIAAIGAPSKVRAANTHIPGQPAELVIEVKAPARPLDQLQYDALYLLQKIEKYKEFRKIIGKGAENDRHADKALAKVTAELESLNKRACTLGSEVLSREGRREALQLYADIYPITHQTDLEVLCARIRRFTSYRLPWTDRLRLYLSCRRW